MVLMTRDLKKLPVECSLILPNSVPSELNWEKTPGSDGLPADFYKVFWNNLADCLVNSINYAYQVRQFSVSQSEE